MYSSTGTTIAGVSNLPIASGGTGATTAAAALTSLGAQAALPGVVTNGSNGVTVTGSVAAAGVTSNTTTSSDNNVINIMAPPYNATCNLMQYGSGSISLNSAVLTGFGFTPSLVGRKIIVWGAGTNIGTTVNPNYEPLITPDPPTHLVNARLGYTRNKLDVTLFCNNLFNSLPELGAFQLPATSNLVTYNTFRPRTIGLSVNYGF